MTQFNDFDITFPSIGPDAIVFQAGGRLYLLDLASEKPSEVPVHVVTDQTTLRPQDRESRIADPVGIGIADRQARGVRGAGRRSYRPGGVWRRCERDPIVGRRPSAIRAGRRTARPSRIGATAPANTS